MTSPAASPAASATSETDFSNHSSSLQSVEDPTVRHTDALHNLDNTTGPELTATDKVANETATDAELAGDGEGRKGLLQKLKAISKKAWAAAKKAARFGRPPRVKTVYSPLPPGYDRNLDPAYARACLSKFGFDETDEDRMVLARVRQHDKRVLAEERRVKREQRAAKRQAKKGL